MGTKRKNAMSLRHYYDSVLDTLKWPTFIWPQQLVAVTPAAGQAVESGAGTPWSLSTSGV